jgi:RimJ/RimL family protein N-acetyltransferase
MRQPSSGSVTPGSNRIFYALFDNSMTETLVRVWQSSFEHGVGIRDRHPIEEQTFARNTAARRFYARQGFVEVACGFESTWQLDDVRLEWVAKASAPVA